MSGSLLRAAVERAATVLVASEPLPDGDAFGSEIALRLMIAQTFGLAASRAEARTGRGPKFVQVLNERAIPERYSFLDGATGRPPGPEDEQGYDLGILVDGGVERTGLAVRAVFERCRARAYVDHHRAGSAAPYDVKIVEPDRAATTEVIFSLIEEDGWSDVKLERPLAEALYVGLIADTGSFMYSLTTPRTHRVAARLLEAGVRATFIAEKVLLDVKLEDLELEAKVVLGLAREHGGRVLVGVLSLDMLDGRDPRLVAYDKIVTPIAFVQGTVVTLLLREVDPEVWKLSFRSRAGVDVSKVARDLDPQGGGHERAAGCELRGPLEDAKRRAVAAIGRALSGGGGAGAEGDGTPRSRS